MSELFQSIVNSISDFDFSDYGLDEVEWTKAETAATAWLYDLAHKIEEDWVKHVDGI
jgi:hypothetical protein